MLEIEAIARKANRRVMVCFVLRFAAFYRKVKEIIQSGALGEIVSIQASEGVMPWHQAHSFVRGHWSVVGRSSPMIISKCCHDTDIVHWLVGRRCLRVASFGSLEFFRPERARRRTSAMHRRLPGGRYVRLQCAALQHRHAGRVVADGL